MDNHTILSLQQTSLKHDDHDQNGTSKIPVAVVMVPLPAQGHLNQLLHLSRLVSAYDIPVHIASTTTHNRQAKLRVQGWDPLSISNITFHNLPIPPFDNPPPNPNSSTKYPTQTLPALNASLKLRELMYTLVEKLAATVGKIVIIYDSLMAYVVQDIRSVPNAKSYCFQSISAFSSYSFVWQLAGKPVLLTEAEIVKELPSLEECLSPGLLEFLKIQTEAPKFNSGILYNTSRVMEGLWLDLLAKENNIITAGEVNWAIGPFNPVSLPGKMDSNSINRHECLDWLDKQDLSSVIFISFGTTSLLPDKQIIEIAVGLERSEQKFIWVLRNADKGDIFTGEASHEAELPEGFEERIRERGIIVRDWAPQLEILGHPSTGGFISHCGWNSCMESISMGVPIATWPMHSDQPANAVLFTKLLEIGLELKNWEQRDELVSSDDVEKTVRKLMASDKGDEIRKRAMKLGDVVKKNLMEGGDTKMEMDSFIAHITR